jgi:hypothetical protein
LNHRYTHTKNGLLALLCCFGWFNGVSQLNIDSLHKAGICSPAGFALPNIKGMPRSKGFELYQEIAPSHKLTSRFEDQETEFTNDLRLSSIWMAKLRAPVINKESFKFIVGLRYYQQEYYFQEPEDLTDVFHQSLQDKGIRSAGLSLNAAKSFVGNKYLVGRATFRLNGNFENGNVNDYLKSSFAVLYGVKDKANRTWGVGASYSNSFGASSFYPLLFLNYKFKEKWAIQALLPVSAKLLFMPNEKNIISINNRLEGDNYNLDFPSLEPTTLYLEYAEFKSFLTYDREIYDFLWFGVSAGMRFNINFDISDSDNFFDRSLLTSNDNIIIANNLAPSPFFRVGIYIVPPRKWLD